jgi:hypothetical protein
MYFLSEIRNLTNIGNVPQNYVIGAGAFGYFSGNQPPVIVWLSCRDKFQEILASILAGGFIFTHTNSVGRNVADFIHEAEEILQVGAYTTFQPTGRVDMIWVYPSPFWLSDFLKRSVFTLLLRCGIAYNGNVEAALGSNIYVQHTKDALARFLSGYTEYKGPNNHPSGHGWLMLFKNANRNKIQTLLWPNHRMIAELAYQKHLAGSNDSLKNWLDAEKELVERW